MQLIRNHGLLALVGLLGILIGIAALLFLVSQPQDTRSRAAAASKLYFTPATSSTKPLTVKPGETVSFDLMVDPGSNLVDTIRAVIDYDPTLLGIPDNGMFFIPNEKVFPKKIQPPTLIGHKIGFTISAGTQDKIVTTPQKVGTVVLKTLKSTKGSPVMISLGNESAILSVGAEAQYAENVLSSTVPAYIIISAPTPTPSHTPTPTPVPGNPTITCTPQSVILSDQYQNITVTLKEATGTPIANKTINWSSTGTIQASGTSTTNSQGQASLSVGVSLTDTVTRKGTIIAKYPLSNNQVISCSVQAESRPITPTPTATPTPTLTPTPIPGETKLKLEIQLHGIGVSGDNVVPYPEECHRTGSGVSDSCLSNQKPLHETRELTVDIIDQQNKIVKTITVPMTYTFAKGAFDATVSLGMNWMSGVYDIRVYTPKYLSRHLTQNITIAKESQVSIPAFDLVSSDVNLDDKIDILDWNMIAACYTFPGIPTTCSAQQIEQVDTDDDNDVDDYDLNLFRRDLSSRSGTRSQTSP